MEKYLVINCHLDYEIYLMIVSISLERQRGHRVALISVCTSCDTYLFMVVSSVKGTDGGTNRGAHIVDFLFDLLIVEWVGCVGGVGGTPLRYVFLKIPSDTLMASSTNSSLGSCTTRSSCASFPPSFDTSFAFLS
jgi:hypothetical protein